MANIANLLANEIIKWDTGVWGSLIGFFDSFIMNYGWTIIVFTLLIKIILIPLDFFQRRASVKQAEVQSKLQPELNRIREKYANNPEKMRVKLQEKQMEFMKSGEMKLGSTCFVMALNLIVTLVVFLTLFSSMIGISNVKTVNTFISLDNAYQQAIADGKTEEQAQEEVLNLYNSGEVTDSWLWIDNLMKPDTSVGVVPTYSEFVSIAKSVSQSPYTFEGENALTEEYYNKVMTKVIAEKQGTWNGYYILIILCGVVSFLSFHISMAGAKGRRKDAGQPMAGGNMVNVMKWILPAIMVMITLFYSAAFSLYILTNSLFTLAATPVYNAILKKMTNKNSNNDNSNNSNTDNINVDYRIKKITKVEE